MISGSRVGVIVLCYNGIDLTMECLASLHHQDYPHLDILVVDNNSQDNTVEVVRQAYPQVKVIAASQNLGYAAGNNLGMQVALQSGADLIFLVNNDTRLAPDCVTTLGRALEADSHIGVIGPMVHTWRSRVISSAGGMINWWQADAVNVGMGEPDRGQYPARAVDFINGCGLMVTRRAIERVGMLDPQFFMYWEETDWCARIRRAGLTCRFEPAARMEHKASIETQELGPTTIYYMTRNRLLFFARHTPWPLKAVVLARAIRGALRGISQLRQAGRIGHAQAVEVALRHAWQKRWGYTDPSAWGVVSA